MATEHRTIPPGQPSGFWPNTLKDWTPVLLAAGMIISGGYVVYGQTQATAKDVADSRAEIRALQAKNEVVMSEVRDLRERANVRLSVIESTLTRIEKKLDQK